jgi:hypothetical protein
VDSETTITFQKGYRVVSARRTSTRVFTTSKVLARRFTMPYP